MIKKIREVKEVKKDSKVILKKLIKLLIDKNIINQKDLKFLNGVDTKK